MWRSFVLHCSIIIWVMLMQEVSLWQFFIGFVIGYLFLYFFPSLLYSRDYIRRLGGLVRFLWTFVKVFFLANIEVARQVLFVPRREIVGKFIEIDIDRLSWFETILYAHLVTLTPGTASVWISREKKKLLIHALTKREDREIQDELAKELLKPILEFTR